MVASQVSRSDIVEAITRTARSFTPAAADTILCENLYKHAYEVDAAQRAAGREGVVCDLGGGVGVNLLVLRRLGHRGRLVLIDSFDEYDETNRMGSWHSVLATLRDHDVDVVRQNFWARPALPLEDGSVDVTTCFDVVEHLPGHPLRQLRELYRVLRPGGRCITSGPNGVSLIKRLRTITGRYPYAPFEAWLSDAFYGHYREYAPAEYEELLRRAGFADVDSHASAAVTLCRARQGYHRRRLTALSPLRVALWGVAAVEVALPGLRHTIYAWGTKPPDTKPPQH